MFKKGFSKNSVLIIRSVLGQTSALLVGKIMSGIHPRVILSEILMMQ